MAFSAALGLYSIWWLGQLCGWMVYSLVLVISLAEGAIYVVCLGRSRWISLLRSTVACSRALVVLSVQGAALWCAEFFLI